MHSASPRASICEQIDRRGPRWSALSCRSQRHHAALQHYLFRLPERSWHVAMNVAIDAIWPCSNKTTSPHSMRSERRDPMHQFKPIKTIRSFTKLCCDAIDGLVTRTLLGLKFQRIFHALMLTVPEKQLLQSKYQRVRQACRAGLDEHLVPSISPVGHSARDAGLTMSLEPAGHVDGLGHQGSSRWAAGQQCLHRPAS